MAYLNGLLKWIPDLDLPSNGIASMLHSCSIVDIPSPHAAIFDDLIFFVVFGIWEDLLDGKSPGQIDFNFFRMVFN